MIVDIPLDEGNQFAQVVSSRIIRAGYVIRPVKLLDTTRVPHLKVVAGSRREISAAARHNEYIGIAEEIDRYHLGIDFS